MSSTPNKSYPRGNAHADSSPVASPSPAVTGSGNRGRFSSKSPSTSQGKKSISPGLTPRAYSPGGTTLLVDGMASKRALSPSSFFKSTTPIADAHIRALSSQINKVPFKAPVESQSHHSSVVAFGATGSNERNAHYKDLLKRTGSAGRSSPMSWGEPGGQLSASYRSKSPIACAHILAVPKPTDPLYQGGQGGGRSDGPSSFYRSGSSIADAHIKALSKPHDSSSPIADISRNIHGPVQASFRSTTSIADAHIKAVPKPADVCVAYREGF